MPAVDADDEPFVDPDELKVPESPNTAASPNS
jgi:hypothetical protein